MPYIRQCAKDTAGTEYRPPAELLRELPSPFLELRSLPCGAFHEIRLCARRRVLKIRPGVRRRIPKVLLRLRRCVLKLRLRKRCLDPALADCLGGLPDGVSHAVRDLPERCTYPLELGKLPVHLVDREHRDDKVRRERRIENDDHDPPGRRGDRAGRKFSHDRLQDPDNEADADPPDHAELKADIALEVEGFIAVIPPAHVKEHVKDRSSDELNEGRNRHAAEEQDKKVCVLNMSARPGHIGADEIRHGKYSHRADPVDRADRSVQKAPVHDHAHAERVIEDLDDPASDRIDCKIHKDLIPCHSEQHIFLREYFFIYCSTKHFPYKRQVPSFVANNPRIRYNNVLHQRRHA